MTEGALPVQAWASAAVPAEEGQQVPEVLDEWKAYTSPEGYTYYYNSRTGVSTWEKPTLKSEQKKPLRDRAQNIGQAAKELSAQWFGAVHHQHLNPQDMNWHAERAAAVHEALHASEVGASWSSSLRRVEERPSKKVSAGVGDELSAQTVRAIEDYIRNKGVCEEVSVLEMVFGVEESRLSNHFDLKEDDGKMYAYARSNKEVVVPAGTTTAKGDSAEAKTMMIRQHFPVFVIAQILICTGLWLIPNGEKDEKGLESIWPHRTNLRVMFDCVDSRIELCVWRWFTYQFTHLNSGHLFANCVSLFFFGVMLEGLHGWWVALVFNIAVLGGACGFLLFDLHGQTVGMSAGCYGLLGMHIGDAVMNAAEQQRAAAYFRSGGGSKAGSGALQKMWRRMFFPPWIKALLVLLYAVPDIALALLTENSRTSHSAHAGGFLAGFLGSLVFTPNFVWKRHEIWLFRAALFACGFLALFSLIWGLVSPKQSLGDSVEWCWARQVANKSLFGDSNFHCVRCSDTSCADRWLATQGSLKIVNPYACAEWPAAKP
eukprot:TRINITY_DN47542_c0_g1_i1.p1 TRINITY_DN47542_c0_g1~~TRINITY_DN47542_c0_g1_i1.p1  ORF type:complete len:543 (-),score=104.57 TRINITY_DN47542_c0_g1_i1:82-1710(-)